MSYTYLITPFLAWLIAGCLKFAINTIRAGKPAFGLIGYGGMPSNHTAIVTSIAALIAFKEGIDNPAFGVAVALAFIVVLDATSLRRKVGQHAEAINKMNGGKLRERMGHTPAEVFGGIVTGVGVGYLVAALPI